MSNLTIEAVPDELVALAATPEGMARARAAVLAAFPELDTRTDQEKALDAFRAQEKASWRAREEKLEIMARESLELREAEASELRKQEKAA